MILRNLEEAKKELIRLFVKHEAIEVKPYIYNRTKAQNRLLWLYCKLIGNDLGYTHDEMKQTFQKEFLSYEKDGKVFHKGTSTLNKVEFIEFIDQIYRYCSVELGIRLPNPSDYYDIEQLERQLHK